MVSPNERALVNFGRNVAFKTDCFLEPKNEDEVLDVLEKHAGRRIHVVGALHSWSEAAVGDDVVLRLARLSSVTVFGSGPGAQAEIGAGCSVQHALEELGEQGLTLPAYGMTGAQSIAGAIATATHGSGRSSMAHYVASVRIATYDRHGKPTERVLSSGAPLLAACCALGRAGIVLSVRVPCAAAHFIEERSRKFSSLAVLLDGIGRFPWTQFYLLPWAWVWIAQLRRPVNSGESGNPALILYQLQRAITLGLVNLAASLLARMPRCGACARLAYRVLAALFTRSSVVARAELVQMTKHRRYVEMELFVPTSRIEEAADLIQGVLRYLAGEDDGLPETIEKTIADAHGGLESLRKLRGTYVHHYPITFRYVRRDAAFISMTSDEDMYAISFITLSADLATFHAAAAFLALTMARAFGARLHWGKVFPLDAVEVRRLVPGLGEFENQCKELDPTAAFSAPFTRRVLGF
jgi:FAD/FMN-containing dehydrogenase